MSANTRSLEGRVRKWLADNKTAIARHDGYPAEFLQQQLFALVEPHSKVAWLEPRRPGDKERRFRTGAVMILTRGNHAAVLVTGSKGATPAVVDSRNIIWCDKAPKRLKR
jgi:hypothetical protein